MMIGLRKSRLWEIALLGGALLFALFYLAPFLTIVLTSFKPAAEVIASPPRLLPSHFSIENYLHMASALNIGRSMWNSLVVTFGSTAIAMALGSMAGYAVARSHSPVVRSFFLLALLARVVPPVTLAIPILGMIRWAGLIDTQIGLILVHAALNLPFVIWMSSGFFQDIPADLEEAAIVDGCNRFTAFTRIILPVATPGLAATAIFAAMLSWNEYLFALLLTNVEAKTAPVAVSELLNVYSSEWGAMTAAGTLFTIPVLILAIIIQRRIVEGMAMGAVKG
ncbi:sugar ABC transporter permease [Sphingomonas oleivorans]|uniref:Sugar ABC transporter permease n=1 Tax=Sphingomonas oleivorans TaxID=1735121 RepID=A0A2T5FVJ3_9SPHN|nr:carbohydrate ABC transporter permease [Sphingomonas oleivorans]PTQ09798.1 sugar ABC transporter permease [Sphingomonas oleivorans]